jgi:hypothetical protein
MFVSEWRYAEGSNRVGRVESGLIEPNGPLKRQLVRSGQPLQETSSHKGDTTMKSKRYLFAASVALVLAATGGATAKSKYSAIGPMYKGSGKVSSIHPEPVKPTVQEFKGSGRIHGWTGLKGGNAPYGFKGLNGFKGFKH